MKFRRPTDAEVQFEFSYFYEGKWTEEMKEEYTVLAIKEIQKNVVFKPWAEEIDRSKFGFNFDVQKDAKVVTVTVRGDYL